MPKASRNGRRTWAQRVVLTINVVAIFVTLSVAGALTYFNHRLGQVQRVEFGRDVLSTDVPAGDPQNYLIVGADSDEGLGADDFETKGRTKVEGIRSDTIMILRVDPKETKARILSFPRDLWLTIAGTGGKQRINTAIQSGGPEALVNTIRDNFGIEIHHYLEVNFFGFKELVAAVDGVPVYFPEPARDRKSGFSIPEAGCYTLDPTTALAFARGREYQVYRDGRWRTDPSTDLGRIERQQFFIQQALQRAVEKGARSPGTLRRLVELGVNNVTLDDELRPKDILGLGRRFKNFNPANLERFSLPVVDKVVGGAMVLDLQVAEAQPILDLFRGVEPGTIAPAAVRVQVLNGSGTPRQASEVTAALVTAGFVSEAPSDAEQRPSTLVRFLPGKTAEARLVARYLEGPVEFEEAADLAGDVTVVTGSDFTTVLGEPKPESEVGEPESSAPSTTTTLPGSTTTTAPTDDATATPPAADFVPDEVPEGMDCR
jgi:LCP family protein required for cell wall assembly